MQIVGYATDAGDGESGLLFSDGNGSDVEFRPTDPGSELSYTLGDRRCAGTVHTGEHLACDAEDAPYCRDHADTWVCARCTGTCLKDEMDCHEKHAIYLAAFAPDLFKVGVTRLWRLETRLREQGADRGAHIRTVPDGRIARELEAEVAARDDLPVPVSDSVRVDRKRRGLGRGVDVKAWPRLCSAFDPHETFAFDYGLDLDRRPVAETMLTGTVRGTKGRILVLDRGASTYAVDLRDLVGHEVVPERSRRERQSSLGAFERN
ncbi:hypothetical protein AArcSl_1033 [Halalkaliarchaeum desulfuricum]|uniref:DUF2797 domain-containing protein n=1 Tax=Halalkaliarchaeum desulfuricum TaxID=2055893 RepID=A0A343THU9_9EURY|nr:hypothetical protein AArcSl_1033 [Halalkaliarchaeum desulfuricum]